MAIQITIHTKSQITTNKNTQQKTQKKTNAQKVLDKGAIDVCARKVASMDGDVRKALDVCRYELYNSRSNYVSIIIY